jgi:predicted NAD/FAD-binding protein
MNDLQHISEADHGPVLVTLNPPFDPRPETVSGRYTYEHPVLNAKVR